MHGFLSSMSAISDAYVIVEIRVLVVICEGGDDSLDRVLPLTQVLPHRLSYKLPERHAWVQQAKW